jgi:hypothetical protein
MLRYFPFTSFFDTKMGTVPLPHNTPVVEVDEHYQNEVKLKRSLLQQHPSYYYQSSPTTLTTQWEVVEKILTSLSTAYPNAFTFRQDEHHCFWENKKLAETIEFDMGDLATLPFEPLDWVGRQVQEDLLILDGTSILQAGQLCFPSGWDLSSKFGLDFLELHGPVPAIMGPMLQSASQLIERIPSSKPIARNNWGYRISDQLDLSTRHTDTYLHQLKRQAPEITEHTAGHKIFLRSERQILSRLPVSGWILFTIHTYHSKVKEEAKNPARAKAMLAFLKTAPKEIIEYKSMTPLVESLIRYLERIVAG